MRKLSVLFFMMLAVASLKAFETGLISNKEKSVLLSESKLFTNVHQNNLLFTSDFLPNYSLMKKKRGGGGSSLFIKGDLWVSARSGGKPGIGPNLSFISGDEVAYGGSVSFIYFLGNTNATAFYLPLNGLIRYYVSGGGEGFYPEGGAGFTIYHFSSNNQYLTISSTNTYFNIFVGAGYKTGNVDFGASFYNIFTPLVSATYFSFKVGFGIGG